MDPFLSSVFGIVYLILDLYVWIIIIQAILSWLVAFNVVNTSNRVVYLIGDFTYRLTEPVLRPVRNVMPNLGGIDLSPLVVILGIFFIQSLMINYGLAR